MKVSACATCGHGYVIMDGQPLHGVGPIGPILQSISGLGNMLNTGVAPPDVGNMLDPQACTAFPATSSIAPLEHLG